MLSSQGRQLVAQHDEFDVLRELGPQPTVPTHCAISSASAPHPPPARARGDVGNVLASSQTRNRPADNVGMVTGVGLRRSFFWAFGWPG